ncbi:MAG TPA: PAS domain S-box protein [Vicinamibacterales bacterium]|nr:PAS domain S-box protein [Vicinamibacterales bacterium]
MGPFVLLHVVLVGVFASAALYAASGGWLLRASPTRVLFVALCLTCAALSACLTGVAMATSAADAAPFLRGRLVLGLGGMALTAALISRIAGVGARLYVAGVTLFAAALSFWQLLMVPLSQQHASLARLTLPWGEQIGVPVWTARPWWFLLVYAVMLSVDAFGLFASARLLRTDRSSAAIVGLASAVSVVTTLVSSLTDLGGRTAPYLGTAPFAVWVALLSLQTARDTLRTRQRLVVSEQRLRAIFDHTLHFMGLLDADGVVLEANRPVLASVGVRPEDVIGRLFWQTPIWAHSAELRERVRDAVASSAAGETVRFETWHPLPDRSIGYVDFSVTPISDERGRVILLVPEGRDVTGRKKTQAALARLADVVGSRTGQDFFQTMVNTLCEICEVDMVMVASLDPEHAGMVRTIAVSMAGQTSDNFSYVLRGTPCETIIGRELCYYPTNVQALFPDDRSLVDLRIDSYMGIPFGSSDGVSLGLVALLRHAPIEHPDQAKALLQVVAARAGAELERRRTDAALRDSEGRFRALIDDLDVGVLTRDANERTMIGNPAAARMLGLTLEQLRTADPGNQRMTITMEDGSPYPADMFPSTVAVRTKRPVRNAIVGIANRQGGERTWLQVTATPQLAADESVERVLITLVDVTERKRAEDAVRASSRRLALAISATSDAVWEWNYQTNETYYSPRWFEMLGVSPDMPMTLETFKSLCHPDDLAPAFAGIDAALQARSGWEIELRMKRGDGSWAWVLGRGKAVEWDADGRAVLLAGTNTDVTQRKEAESRRRDLEMRLAQAQRMESVGRLAGGIAHDFNNILTVINGYSDLLLHTARLDAAATAMLVDIRDAGDRAAALTGQLLTFSRHQVVDPETLELNVVVGDTERMLQRLIGEQITMTTHFCDTPLWVRADASQLGQVVVNLVVNARDAMPNGGALTIATSHVIVNPAAAAPLPDAPPGEYAVLSVSDTGTGIPVELKELVFEPFFTTKGVGKGTGLGLTTVDGIVRQSHGYLTVHSQPGAGTTFTIYLPLVDEPGAERPVVTERQDFTIGDRTILMVEDEVAVRNVTEVMLRRMGLHVIAAANADHALAVSDAHEGAIDLLLTDVIMPGLNGRQLAERLLALRPGLRVLYMSGYTDDAVVQEVVLNADATYIQKPFDAETLARKVRQALEAVPPGATA